MVGRLLFHLLGHSELAAIRRQWLLEPPEREVRSPGMLDHAPTNGFSLAALKAMLPQSNTL